MPSRNLLAQIHIAKKDLGLTDTEYRDILYNNTKKESSKDISDPEALKVIGHFKSLGWPTRRGASNKPLQSASGNNSLRFEEFGKRKGWATPAQLRKIHATWMTYPKIRQKTESALRSYLFKIHKISDLRFVPAGVVGKILKSIQAINTGK